MADILTNQDSAPPTTTIQEDLTVASQRKINLIWERTQSTLAIMVVGAIVVVVSYNAMTKASIVVECPPTLSNMGFLIVGFYFSRTNHAAIGGIGNKPNPPYEGR
jgi:hypothetical protein